MWARRSRHKREERTGAPANLFVTYTSDKGHSRGIATAFPLHDTRSLEMLYITRSAREKAHVSDSWDCFVRGLDPGLCRLPRCRVFYPPADYLRRDLDYLPLHSRVAGVAGEAQKKAAPPNRDAAFSLHADVGAFLPWLYRASDGERGFSFEKSHMPWMPREKCSIRRSAAG